MFTALGKQVLRNGQHYADACDTFAADDIAQAMNANEYGDAPVIEAQADLLCLGVRRRENDEYVCSCGVRYDVREDHP